MPDETSTDVYGAVTTRPPFDPELVPAEAAMRAFVAAPTIETLPALRTAVSQSAMLGAVPTDLTAGGRVHVEERQIPGPDGAPEITALILRPAGERGPVAGLFNIHGGGMVSGDRRTGIELVLPYVAAGSAVAVSIEYRLAPEHPDPAPVEDCYAGLAWTGKHAVELGIDPDTLIVIGGSAGGGLAAGTALLARDRGFPALSHQVLLCPMLDDRFVTHSSRMLDGEGVWDRNANLFGWTSLLGQRRGGPDVSQYAAPARAQDLTGLPRTYIDTGSVEVFRDEAVGYAIRLSQAGVSVDLHMWGGAFHGSDGSATHAAVSQASISTRDEFIRRALEA